MTSRGRNIRRALLARQALGEPIGRPPKRDYARVFELRQQGYSADRISVLTGIAQTTISYVIRTKSEGIARGSQETGKSTASSNEAQA